MTKLENVEMLDASLVIPDENQPRKLFEASKMVTLKKSIEHYGIMSPLIVEKVGGKYLLVDGERRFRAASELRMKKVPAIILTPQSPIDRLIQQFHIQEQHEGWTATEKAVTLFKLSKEMGITPQKAFQLLGINKRTADTYLAFGSLIDKDAFQRNDLGMDWASQISGLKTVVRKIYERELEQDFDRTSEKALEKAVIKRITEGSINRRHEMTQLKDAFVKDPKSIKKFLETDVTPMALFIATKAKGAYHLRNLRFALTYTASHILEFLKVQDIKVDPDVNALLKLAKGRINELLSKVE